MPGLKASDHDRELQGEIITTRQYPGTIRVFITDDHALIRRKLKQYISVLANLDVVGEAGNGLDTLRALSAVQADLLLLDFSLPDMNGCEIIRQLRSDGNKILILMITMFEDAIIASEVIKEGAQGYLLKEDVPAHVTTAIILIVAGHCPWVSPSLRDKLQL